MNHYVIGVVLVVVVIGIGDNANSSAIRDMDGRVRVGDLSGLGLGRLGGGGRENSQCQGGGFCFFFSLSPLGLTTKKPEDRKDGGGGCGSDGDTLLSPPCHSFS